MTFYMSLYFQAHSKSCKKLLLNYVRLSVRIEKIDSNWTDFRETLFGAFIMNCGEKFF